QGRWGQATASAAGLSLCVTLVGSIPVAVLGFAFGGILGLTFAAVAVMLPGLLLQDAWRLAFFGLGRPDKACLNDAAYLLLEAVGFLTLAYVGNANMYSLILVWGAAGYATAALGVWQSGVI